MERLEKEWKMHIVDLEMQLDYVLLFDKLFLIAKDKHYWGKQQQYDIHATLHPIELCSILIIYDLYIVVLYRVNVYYN